MSIDLCFYCNNPVDTDKDPDCYIDNVCVCGICQEVKEEADHLLELNRGYAQDRI